MKIFAKVFLLLAGVSAVPLGATRLLVMRQSTDLQRELLRKSGGTEIARMVVPPIAIANLWRTPCACDVLVGRR